MEIVYGTKNPAKLDSMRVCLEQLRPAYDIAITGLDESVPDIPENGNNPLENARIKAKAYYDLLRRPVFSADSGLYFDGLIDALQPGINVRRVNGKRLTDGEMLDYYAGLAKRYGDLTARYQNGICLIWDENTVFEHNGDDIATDRFIICGTPHPKRKEGFPLDCLSVHIESGQYYNDMYTEKYDKEEVWRPAAGFRRFFKKVMDSVISV